MTDNLETIREKAAAIWSWDDDHRKLCLAIIDLAMGDASHISFTRLLDMGKQHGVDDPKVVFRIADYLTGDEANVLQSRFEFIDDSDEPWQEVFSLEDILVARRENSFINPRTGQKVPNFEEHLFLFFEPTAFAKKMGSGKT
jgi:hypothetical protein